MTMTRSLSRMAIVLMVCGVFCASRKTTHAYDDFWQFELQMCYTQCDIDEYECRRDGLSAVTRYYFGFDICEIQMMMCYERCQMMYLPPME